MEPVRIGVSGLGGFGQFVLAAFAATPEVKVVAVHDVDAARAQRIAQGVGVSYCKTYSELAAHPDVEMVYLATPPAMHGPATLEALDQGKHVFVEKPLATTHDEVDAIIAKAAELGLRVGINYVLRYNPIYRLAVRLGRSGMLGHLRHMTLENDASDENLPPGHWFWDPTVSGTILVEHGVHFFDIAAQLAGAPGEHRYSQTWTRAPHGFVDRVLAVARYGDVPATFYHAFDKPGRIERTAFRLAYDVGYITVHGWMPTHLTLDAVLDDAEIVTLQEIAALSTLEMGADREATINSDLDLAGYPQHDQQTRGREQERTVTHRVKLSISCPEGKQAIYARTIQAAAADFARSIRDPHHVPEVSLTEAAASVRLAIDATQEADRQA